MGNAIVIFGASGDLTARKLIPALYNNYRKRRLPEQTCVVGFSRSVFSDDEFRAKMRSAAEQFLPKEFDESEWRNFARFLFYQPGDVDVSDHYAGLGKRLKSLPAQVENTLFYLATAPALYSKVVSHLRDGGLLTETNQDTFRRIIIEKPFGTDLATAVGLNNELHSLLNENQIYRIDHYLGKETVQNLLVFRFGNAIFEPLWNRNYIDHVQITVSETVGVEHRAGYYDHSGVLRDMFQNHLLQLLTLVAMESPGEFEAESLRNEKVKILKAVREIPPEYSSRYTVRGQYDGYLNEKGVASGSQTETFAAVQFAVGNWRWQGVPFFLRSGKKLKEKMSEISIQFRRPPTQILDLAAGRTELFTNRLTISIQPDEGIHLRFLAKVPDQGLQTHPVEMNFHFRDSFAGTAIPEAYERLLLDAMSGDASLFTRSDEIELSWKLIDTIREGWNSDSAPPLLSYAAGSWGPLTADRLIGREGRWWVHDSGDR